MKNLKNSLEELAKQRRSVVTAKYGEQLSTIEASRKDQSGKAREISIDISKNEIQKEKTRFSTRASMRNSG